jgi:hypothetical protein
MPKKNQIRSKLQELKHDDVCNLNKILEDLGYESSECIEDLLNCDIDSDDEEIANILEKLTPKNTVNNITPELFSIGKKFAKFSDPEWSLPDHIFSDIANAISDYSSYQGTRTVLFNNKGLQIKPESASTYTTKECSNVEEKYRELLKRIEDYATNLDKNNINDNNTLCCLAKLYYKATQLDHNNCNQENAMDLASLLQYFAISSISLAGILLHDTTPKGHF